MKKLIYFVFLLNLPFYIYSQGRLVLNNNVYIVIGNNTNLVIDNNATNAITTLGTGGNIISEGETNRLLWNVGTGTGNYIIPSTTPGGVKIPVSINISTAGVGGGSISYSTYTRPSWDNNTYRPSDVTNMNNKLGVNNSGNVIDRFWLIDLNNYTTKPTSTITFKYSDTEWSAAGNTIIESSLFTQRFNSATNNWGDWYGPFGTADIVNNTVSTGVIAPADFFRSWTLVNESSPLPVELLSFNGYPEENIIKIVWSTATEINNNFFTVERSANVVQWKNIGIVRGAGNSNTLLHYNLSDTQPMDGINYYRLKQTDFDGKFKYSEIISVNFSFISNLEVAIFPNPTNGNFSIIINGKLNKEFFVKMINSTGQLMLEKTMTGNMNSVDVSDLKPGIYLLKLDYEDQTIYKKIICQ